MFSNDPNRIHQAIASIDEACVKGHNELAKILNQLSAYNAKVQQQAQIDTLKELITHSYSSAATYTNFIIVAGYVAFFTVWKSMKPDLGKILMLSSCLSVLISVVLFIISEIHKMLATSRFHRVFFEKIKVELPSSFVDDYKKEAQAHERAMFRWWLALFVPTLLLGLLGGGLLLYAFADSLIRELFIYFQG